MNFKASLVASFMLASLLTGITVESAQAQSPDIPQGAGSGSGVPGAGDQGNSQGRRMRKMDPQRTAKMRARMMKRFDTNGDGSLDETEQAQMQAARKNRRGHGRKHRGGRNRQNQNGASGNSGCTPSGGAAGSPAN